MTAVRWDWLILRNWSKEDIATVEDMRKKFREEPDSKGNPSFPDDVELLYIGVENRYIVLGMCKC